MNSSLRHYACGQTRHDLRRVFRGAPRETREFPAGVFLYDDGSRRVLLDTGYETGTWHTGWKGRLYRRMLPVDAQRDDSVTAQLAADGIDPALITHVVLSHLHPDHIGGIRHFPHARFILTAGQLRTLEAPRLREGLLAGLLPDWFPSDDTQVLDAADFQDTTVAGVSLRTARLFDDDRCLAVDLPGHARGHIGLLIEGRVLLAGDAAWGVDLIAQAPRLRALPKAVQHDADAYLTGAGLLRDLVDAGIRVVCSHDPLTQRELL